MFRLFIILSLLHLTTGITAQYWFEPLKTSIGTNMVESIFRDHKDYLWIGNQRSGLMQYDGYSIQRFLHDDNDTTTISSDEIKCILEDSDHTLWIGTKKGLNKFIPETNQFVRYYFNEYPKAFYIEDIKESPTKDLYVLTQNGLFIKSRNSNSFKRLSISSNIYENYFTCIDWDIEGNAWCGTTHYNGLFRLSKDHNKFISYKDNNKHKFNKGIKTLLIDHNNEFWYGQRGTGFATFSPNTQKFTFFQTNKDGKGLSGNFITSILEVDSIHIFIGIDQGGINVLNKQSNTITYISDDDPTFGNLTSNGIYYLYKDYENIIWAGTSRGGVCYWNPKERRFISYNAKIYKQKQTFSYFPLYGYNSTFCEDSFGIIWIGTDGGGVMTFDPTTKIFKPTDQLNQIQDTKSINIIRSIQEDSEKNIWIATWQGDIIKYDRQKNAYLKIPFHTNLDTNPFSHEIWSMHIDKKDRFWILNPFGTISLYDKNKKLLYSNFIGDSVLSSKDPLVYESKDNQIFLSLKNGIYTYDENNKTIKKIISEKGIVFLDLDTEKNLWIANNQGYLFHYNPDGSKLDSILISSSNGKALIKGIACHNDQVWISTNSGLVRYNTQTKEQTYYNAEEGLQGKHFFLQSVLKTKNGDIYFGGSNGFTYFHPEEIIPNKTIPPVYINKLIVSQNKSNKDTTILTKIISTQNDIVLPWKNRQTLQFEFTGINYTYPSKNKFKYKLHNFDNQWNNTNSFSRNAIYTNLPPGEYTFQVIACNNDEIWNQEGKSIKLTLLPPFWKTKTFYLLLFIILLSLIFLVIKYRERNIKKNSQRLKEQVDKRTAVIEKQKETLNFQNKLLEEKNLDLANNQTKLEQQNNELEMHRQNLERMVNTRTADLLKAKEKAEESDRLKSSFLANMSHEIRTPMNAIIGFSSLLNDMEITNEDREYYVSLITQNSDVLLHLVEDILDFSLIESNQIKIQNNPFGLNELLESVYNSFAYNIDSNTVKFLLNNPLSEKNIQLNSDEFRIRQILVNLISNSFKFTKKGKIEFGSRINNSTIEIYVKDTGPGMSIDEQKLIFNQFVKLDKTMKENKRGIGLGLSISKSLASLLGGSLTVYSQINKGSEFILTLKL